MTEQPISEMETTQPVSNPCTLARRAVECPGWKWMPGMLAVNTNDYGAEIGRDRICGRHPYATEPPPILDSTWPDLNDPATLGCLLALVREAWGEADAAAVREANEIGQWWVVRNFGGDYFGEPGKTEAEALVYALEAVGGEG